MKGLLIALLIMVISTVGIPLLLVGLMYDSSTESDMPVELYTDDADAMQMLLESIDESIAFVLEDDANDFTFRLTQDMVNVAIFNAIRGMDDETEAINPDYMPTEDCESASCKYIIEEMIDINESNSVFLRVHGVWVTFEEDEFHLNVGYEIQHNDGFTFKSTVKTEFTLQDDAEAGHYYFAFNRVRIGNLPLPKALFSTLTNLAFNLGDIDAETLEEEIPLGDLDIRDFSYTLKRSDITDLLREQSAEENDPALEVAAVLLQSVFDNDLFSFKVQEGAFDFNLRMSLIRNPEDTEIPAYLQAMHTAEGTFDPDAFDPEKHFETLFETFVYNAAFSGDETYALTINQRSFNKLLYHQLEGFEEFRFPFDYTDSSGDEQTLTFAFEALWIDIDVVDDNGDSSVVLHLNGLFDFGGIKSLLTIRADEVLDYEDNAYAFDITEIALGKDPTKDDYLSITDLEPIKRLLGDIDNFGFGYISDEYYIVIDTGGLETIFDEGAGQDLIDVTAITLVDNAIRIEVEPTNPELKGTLDQFTGAVKDVFKDNTLKNNLETRFEDFDEDSPEKKLIDIVGDIGDKLENDEMPDQETIETMVDTLSTMDPASRDAFLDALKETMDPAIFDEFEQEFGW